MSTVKASSAADRGDRYRPDIDGLRAIAVTLVVVYHAQKKPSTFPGGYVGVDVFFVISGYLLTGIIAREIARNDFSIARFYERRARRILPALVAMLLTTTALGLLFLLPSELVSYAKSLVAAAFSYSNLYFWTDSNYFNVSLTKPLVHTWSLAVEEQFYLILPLLLLAVTRLARPARVPLLAALAASSLGWSAWSVVHDPTAAFYSPVSRAWELLVGSLLSFDIVPRIAHRWMRECVGLVGIVLIAYAAAYFDATTAFPGASALVPCGGALFVLWAGRDGASSLRSMLSWRPVVFIGLISYSVYLWHYPIFAYARMGLTPLPNHWLYIPIMVGSTFAVGALSWKFVEQPFRCGRFRASPRRTVFVLSGSAIAACALVAVTIVARQGFPSRFSSEAVSIAAYAEPRAVEREKACFLWTGHPFSAFDKASCLNERSGRRNYLLLGDSHAMVLREALAQELPAAHILQATSSGCNVRVELAGSDDCSRLSSYIFHDYLQKHRVAAIFLSGRWGRGHDLAQMTDTIAWCKRRAIPVYLLGIVMEYNGPLPRLLAYARAYHDLGIVSRGIKAEMFKADTRLQEFAAKQLHVPYISLMDEQCPKRRCLAYADPARDVPMLFDDNHLTIAASKKIVGALIAKGLFPRPEASGFLTSSLR